jgi:hypothetical protein
LIGYTVQSKEEDKPEIALDLFLGIKYMALIFIALFMTLDWASFIHLF